jgi:formylglycine-generating enzyme required for sulfatase activity
MKSLFFILGVFTLTSFSEINNPIFELKSINKNFVKVKSDLYVSKYEVSNLDYRNFLTDIKNNNKFEIYMNCLPDTLVWKNDFKFTEPFVQFYFRNPSYDNYPVVGISYESAIEYCNWLTDKYNNDTKKKYKKVFFKLLNKEEWTFAANKDDASKVYTWGSGFMQNNRKQNLCNYKSDSSLNEKTMITSPTNSFYPNSFGLYNMCGNVAEMIEEKGIAKGGSFDDTADKVRIASEKLYNKPQADIGFRISMKIIEE